MIRISFVELAPEFQGPLCLRCQERCFPAQPATIPSIPGKVVADAYILLTDLDGEYVYWCWVVGKPAVRSEYDLDSDHVGQSALNRDYQYMDYETGWLDWDEENEIGKSNGEFRRSYGHQTYFPDIVNDYYNQGEHGAFYPGHRYHDPGKEGNDGYYVTACQNNFPPPLFRRLRGRKR